MDVVEEDRLIAQLKLKPHPEGGHYAETWRDLSGGGARGHSSLIYFLLRAGEESRWHRIDAAEVWHFYRGAPLELRIGRDIHILGNAIGEDQAPQIVVPPGAWQAARSLGDYTLVGCSVAPGFSFDSFELAPENFSP